jgi:hypothetical protein
VVRAMREAAGDAGIAAAMVPIPGQPTSMGLTALLHSSSAPYPQQAEHLASFGAQAAGGIHSSTSRLT